MCVILLPYKSRLGNHPGKSGHDLTNILTFDTGLAKLASFMFYYDNKNNTGLTNKMLLTPALQIYRLTPSTFSLISSKLLHIRG